jgi:hypothetical protein
MATKENNRIMTPLAEAMWPFVTKPASKYQSKDQEYKITVLMDPNKPEHKTFLGQLKTLWEECGKEKKCPGGKPKHFPAKRHLSKEDGSDTGLFEVTFKTGTKYPPRVFDAQGNKVTGDLNIGNGSQVRVAGSYSFYGPELNGGGVKLYLSAVQVVELVEWTGGTAADYGFGIENGFNVEAPFQNEFPPEDTGNGGMPIDEDIPF